MVSFEGTVAELMWKTALNKQNEKKNKQIWMLNYSTMTLFVIQRKKNNSRIGKKDTFVLYIEMNKERDVCDKNIQKKS